MRGQGPRVVLLMRDGLYARLFYKQLTSKLNGKVVGIVFSSSYLNRGAHPLHDLSRYVARVGFGYAVYQALVSCHVPLFCHSSPSIRMAIRQQNIPVHVTNDVNAWKSESWMASLDADFILSFHFNQRIGMKVISLARVAALNFHPSLLPMYRGVDPVLFTLADRQQNIGASVHLLSDELDEGDVLLQKSYPVQSNSLIENNALLFSRGGELAAQVINDFDRFNISRENQGEGRGRYFGWDQIKRVSILRKRWR